MRSVFLSLPALLFVACAPSEPQSLNDSSVKTHVLLNSIGDDDYEDLIGSYIDDVCMEFEADIDQSAISIFEAILMDEGLSGKETEDREMIMSCLKECLNPRDLYFSSYIDEVIGLDMAEIECEEWPKRVKETFDILIDWLFEYLAIEANDSVKVLSWEHAGKENGMNVFDVVYSVYDDYAYAQVRLEEKNNGTLCDYDIEIQAETLYEIEVNNR